MDLSSIMLWVYIIIGVAILAIFGVWFFYLRTFNKMVTVFIKGHNTSKMVCDVARFIVDKNNIGWWQFKTLKDQVQIPSRECLFIDSKGRECAFFEKKGDLDYRPITLMEIKEESRLGFGPISQQSKMNYAYQFKKSLELKSNTLAALIEKYAPYFILVIVAVIGMIAYDTIGKHSVAAADSAKAAADSAEKMGEMLVQAQLILNQNMANGTVVPAQRPIG